MLREFWLSLLGGGSSSSSEIGIGPPRFENVRSRLEVNRLGTGAQGPAGGSQGQAAKFGSGGT